MMVDHRVSYLRKYSELLSVLSLIILYAGHCSASITTVTEHEMNDIIISNKLVLAFIRPSDVCDANCVSVKGILANVAQATVMMGLKVIDVQSLKLLKAFEPSDSFKIFYYRNEVPLLYEATLQPSTVEDLMDWLNSNQEALMKRLNEDDFEHLTQASTGATTGDWFILFYAPQCQHFIPIWETLAVRLNQHKMVAVVNTESNPSLKERFGITKCPTAFFFRSGKMYEYILPSFELTSLTNFAEGWFQNAPSKVVPPIQTPFDKLTDNIAQWLKHTPVLILTFIGVLIVCCLLVICCAKRFTKSKPKLY